MKLTGKIISFTAGDHDIDYTNMITLEPIDRELPEQLEFPFMRGSYHIRLTVKQTYPPTVEEFEDILREMAWEDEE